MNRGSKVTIANGQSESSVLNLFSGSLVGIIMPDGWDAGDISLLCALMPGEDFLPVHTRAGDLFEIVNPGPDRIILFNRDEILFLPGLIKFKAAVNQTDDREIIPIIG